MINYKLIRSHRASQILKNFIRSNGLKRIWYLPRNICPIILEVLFSLDISFVLIDVDDKGFFDLNKLDVDSKLKIGLLFVEAYGENKDTNNVFYELKNKYDILIIKDKCLSIPLIEFDYISDMYSDLILYSTGYSKYIDLKEGGFAFLNLELRYIDSNDFKSDMLTFSDRYENNPFNHNWNEITFQELSNVINLEKIEKEKKNKRILTFLSKNNISFQLISEIWRFTIVVENVYSSELVLNENGLKFGRNYPCMLHQNQIELGCKACIQHSKIINIFNDFRLKHT